MGMGEKGEWTKSEGEGRAGAWGARGQVGARVGGAGDRFGGVPTRAHVAGGVGMRFGHRAGGVEHQHPPALRAHQASRSHRTVIGRCGFAFAWRGTCKFIECHVSWLLS